MSVLRDLRHALRGFAQRPGWTALAVLTLAVGIGANTALFTYLASILWPTLDAPEPERLVWFSGSNTPEEPSVWALSSIPDFRDYEAGNEVFALFAAGDMFAASVVRDDGTVFHSWGTAASGDFFALFAKSPHLGRLLGPQDDRPEAEPVVVLSHSFWRRAFDADPGVIGRTILLDGHRPLTVVGVTGPTFQAQGVKSSYYVSFTHLEAVKPALKDREARVAWAFGRLREGVSFEQARTSFTALARGIDEAHPREKPRSVVLQWVTEAEGGEALESVMVQSKILMAAVALFLVLACANVANLLLARALERRREIGIRLALGAGRFHLGRRIAVESALLALVGGAAGLGLGWAGTRALNSYFAPTPFGMGDWGAGTDVMLFDQRVVVFTVGATVLAALVFGLAPLAHAWRQDLVSALKRESGDARPGRRIGARQLLVLAQLALSVMLLLGAGLLTRTFWNLRHVDPGFPTDGLFLASFYVPNPPAAVSSPLAPPGGITATDEAARLAFYREVVERTRNLPGVEAAGLTFGVPLAGHWPFNADVTLPDGEIAPVRWGAVGPGYFETLGVPLVAGRALTRQDDADTPPVALVNHAFAERFWPAKASSGGIGGESTAAVGQAVVIAGDPGEPTTTVEIVGVIGDVHGGSLHEAPRPAIYQPYAQKPTSFMTLALRAAAGAQPAPRLERLVREEYPKVALIEMAPFSEQVRRSLSDQRMSADVALAVGLLGLLLATVGLGSVMSYAVSRRGHEIGLRMALGASAGRMVRMVLGEAGRLTAAGLVLGIVGSLAFGRVLESLLYGVVGVADAATLGAVPSVLAGAAILAAWLPARRAARVDPATALRDE